MSGPRPLYIGGRWQQSRGEAMAVDDPATERILDHVAAATVEEVGAAVGAARETLADWSATPPSERAAYLGAIADGLRARQDELAELITAEMGCPLALSRLAQVKAPIGILDDHRRLAASYPWEEALGASSVVRTPVGVVAAITPWNVPLHQILLKVAPALLAGCTVVLKPSEVTPLDALLLAEIAHEAGLPPGVLNVVTGGGDVGARLVEHTGVDMVSFTGGTASGRAIAAVAAGRVARVGLELGGKSASVVLDDADLDAAVVGTVQRCFANSGQVCAAPTRLLAPRARYDEVVDRAVTAADAMTVGDPRTEVAMGPVASARQLERIRSHLDRAVADGARVAAGGAAPPPGLDTGYFVAPTVLADVAPTAVIAQEEVFGPVLAVIAHDGDDHAVAIANGTIYGLSGAVWSGDAARAERVARLLRSGEVLLNGAARPNGAPFGGFKQSGLGREAGRYGIDHYVELQLLARPEPTSEVGAAR